MRRALSGLNTNVTRFSNLTTIYNRIPRLAMTTRKLSVSETTNKKPKLENGEKNPEQETPLQATQTLLKTKAKVWKPLVWIDCEMTGLNVYEDHIIEICCIITDGHMNIIDSEGYESTIYYPKEVLDNMNEWCVDQHGKSGLTAKVLENTDRTLEKVQDELLEYIKRFVEPNKGIMAGNSIHMDKFFMNREFPRVIDYLHYRLIDVSTIMEIGHRHNPELMKLFPKKDGNHTAKSDILESIAQLKWYKKHYLKSKDDVKDFINENKPAAEAPATETGPVATEATKIKE